MADFFFITEKFKNVKNEAKLLKFESEYSWNRSNMQQQSPLLNVLENWICQGDHYFNDVDVERAICYAFFNSTSIMCSLKGGGFVQVLRKYRIFQQQKLSLYILPFMLKKAPRHSSDAAGF